MTATTYRAQVLREARKPLVEELKAISNPGTGEVLVRLKCAALNHRDLWICKGQYAGIRLPCVLGSDGVGDVSVLGEGVDRAWQGRRVVLSPSLDWGASDAAPGAGWRILGMPEEGTFAEFIHIPAANLYPAPAHLGDTEAAALPLAGLTAYRALFPRGRLGSGEKILITGIGGGVALTLLPFALAAGAEAWVTSGSQEKIYRAMELGARGGILYTQPEWAKELASRSGPFDMAVDSAGGPGFIPLIDVVKPGGRIVFFGATSGNPSEFPMRKAYWKHIDILGTTLGSPRDFTAMLRFVEGKKVRPVVDRAFPLSGAQDALDYMESGNQFGKIVLKIRS